jgi:hypothetical protein
MKKNNVTMYEILNKNLSFKDKLIFKYLYKKGMYFIIENYIPIKKQDKWDDYLKLLDKISNKQSLLSLRLILVLAYNSGREFEYHYDNDLKEQLLLKQEEYLLNDKIPVEKRVEFVVSIAKAWLKNDRANINYFSKVVAKLFLKGIKENYRYFLEKFDEIEVQTNRTYFINFLEDNEIEIIEFARVIKDERPLMYCNALSSLFKYYSFRVNIDDELVKKISFELYSVIANGQYLGITSIESNLQELIKYGDSDKNWYEDLFIRLWKIESEKNDLDKESLKNYFLILIYCNKDFNLYDEINENFVRLTQEYQKFELDEFEKFEKFISQVYNLLELYYSTIDNIKANKIINKLDNELLKILHNILNWMYYKNKKFYFYILKQYSSINKHPTNKIKEELEKLAVESSDKFINEFKLFIHEDLDASVDIIGKLLKSSDIFKPYISKILNYVYFMLESVEPQKAQIELQKVRDKANEFYNHYDRGGPSYWDVSNVKYSDDKNILKYASPYRNTSLDMYEELIKNPDENIRANIARDINTPEKILEILSNDSANNVRGGVAINCNTPKKILDILINDKELFVQHLAYKNPNIGIELLRKRAKDKKSYEYIVDNPILPEDIALEICKSNDEYAKAGLLRRKQIPKIFLDILSNDSSSRIREMVSSRNDLSPDILDKLSNDSDLNILYKIASNPNTSLKTLKEMYIKYNDYKRIVFLVKQNIKKISI